MVGSEGWYEDPFGRHDGRWFSDGTATGLVLDGGQTSTDPPPSETYEGPLARMEGAPGPAHFDDEQTYDPMAARARATSAIGRMGSGLGV